MAGAEFERRPSLLVLVGVPHYAIKVRMDRLQRLWGGAADAVQDSLKVRAARSSSRINS
jgi:hypothetical protein